LFFVFWLMITGYDPADLPIGLATAEFATWASLRLLPPSRVLLRKRALAGFILHFLGQSVRSGVQVARLEFLPSMPIRPGFVSYRTHLVAGNLLSISPTLVLFAIFLWTFYGACSARSLACQSQLRS
jgi:multicomponent Na+:H+ antiporter subunit E